jgi:crotonobetainyl-CoA:carnitine CoA-transferase CaiB-like acyl-CoA transferase
MAQAVLAALFHHARTGEGQAVEVPMLECMTSFNLAEHLFGHAFDPPTGPYGYHRVATTARRPYPAADGWIAMLPYSDAQWRAFFDLVGWTQTVGRDARFAEPAARAANIQALYREVAGVTPTRTCAEWIAQLRRLNIPVAPVNRLDALLGEPHMAATGLFERHDHPLTGPYVAMRSPLRFEKTPATIRRHPPALGEHTAEVVEALGLAPLSPPCG